jgi:hypothetical protein
MNMKTQTKITYVLFGVVLLTVAAFLSCVDVPTKGPDPLEAIAGYRFIHAATDLGNVALSVDGVSKGNLSFKGAIGHQQYTAGTREIALSNGEALLVSMTTDIRGTIVLIDKEAGERAFLKLTERRVIDEPTTATGRVRIVHLCPDGPAITFKAVGAETFEWSALSYKGIGAYKEVPAGDYTIEGKAGETPLVSYPVTVGNTRTTIFVIGKAASLDVLAVADN